MGDSSIRLVKAFPSPDFFSPDMLSVSLVQRKGGYGDMGSRDESRDT